MDLTFAIKAVDKASSVVDKVGGKLSGLKGKLGPVFKALALGAAAAAVGIGVALFKIGSDFEEAFNTIAVGTGATGEALEGLKGTFKDVFAAIPTDMASAAAAVADFNTLTGATGEFLQELATEALEAARMMGEDSAALINNAGRAFNAFNLVGEDSSGMLDKFFVISQNTGLSMTKLTGNLQTFGPIMKNAGFSIQETALLFGDLHKAGVDVSRVMPALNAFTRRLAAEGITDLKGSVLDMIESIRDAESTTEALNMATDAFGAEGAQRMTTAIRSGALNLDELTESLVGSHGAILDTAAATMTLGQRFTVLKNRAMVAIEPLATGFLIALQDLADLIMNDVIPPVVLFATKLKEDLTPTVQQIAATLRDDIIPAMIQIGQVVIREILLPALEQYIQMWTGAIEVVKPLLPLLQKVGEFMLDNKIIIIGLVAVIILLVAPWLAVIAVIVLVLAKWDEIKEMLTVTIPQAIDDTINKVKEIPIIGEIFEGVLNAVVLIVTTQFEIIKNIVETTIEAIINIVQFWIAIFKGDWDEAWNEVKELVSGIWDGIFEHIKLTLGLIVALIWNQLNVIVGVIGDAVPLMLQAGKDIIQGLVDGVKDHWQTILLVWFVGLPAAILLAIGALASLLWPLGKDLLQGLWDGAKSIWADVIRWFAGLPGAVWTAIGNVNTLLWGIGKAILLGLLNGLKAAWDEVAGFVGGIAGKIAGLKGPIEDDRLLLVDEGKAIMMGLADGLKQGFAEDVKTALAAINDEMGNIVITPPVLPPDWVDAATPPSGGGGGGGGGGGMDRNTLLGQFLTTMGAGIPNELLGALDHAIGNIRHQWFRELIGPAVTEMIRAFRRDNPDFHLGGIVPGPIGMPVQATLLGGEAVLTRAQQRGMGGVTVNYYHTGPLMGDAIEARNFARLIRDDILRVARGA